jgi:oxaloacetate decarboxylase beta subunit
MFDSILELLSKSGIATMFRDGSWWKYFIMYAIVGVLFYLAIVKKFEPLLLLPIAFGMLLTNLVPIPELKLIHLDYFFDSFYISVNETGLTGALASRFQEFIDALNSNEAFKESLKFAPEIILGTKDEAGKILFSSEALSNPDFIEAFNVYLGDVMHLTDRGFAVNMSVMVSQVLTSGGLIDILYLGVKLGIYPSLIFLGIGAMTDFSPLIARPSSLFMGAAAQLGVFAAFFFALFLGFSPMEAGAIGIIGGADGPTAILVTKELAPHLLGAIAIAAYSYMALIPIIQPPFMKLLTTDKERKIKMTQPREVSKLERVIFPIIVTLLVVLIIPDAAPLVGFLMLGNLFNVSGVTDRLSKTGQNELINIVTIFLGVSVGATASAENFIKKDTLFIIGLGLAAFCLSTIGGLLMGKIMCKLSGGKINPLIGSAGVSAVPMAARVSQDVGRKYDPSNFLLMHAMGPNVAGVIGSAVAAGVFLTFFA